MTTLETELETQPASPRPPGVEVPAAVRLQRTVITPPRGWPIPDFRELWRYRDLLALLTGRNIAIIYRQSFLGIGWAVLRPLISMAIFTIIFGRVAGLADETGDTPYAVFVFAGLVPWLFFSTCLSSTSQSVVQHADMLTKVYFPRLIMPLAAVGVATVDFLVQFVLLLGLMALFGIWPSTQFVFAPLFLFASAAAALAGGLWLTALNVRFRDIKHAVPFLVQILMYLTPVIYPVKLVPESWRWVLYLNPMFGLIDGFRWAMLGHAPPDWRLLAVSLVATIIVLIGGLMFFKKTETSFADII